MEIVLIVGIMLGFTLFGMYMFTRVLNRRTDARIARLRKRYGDMLRRLSK